jgi:hypothetical protein
LGAGGETAAVAMDMERGRRRTAAGGIDDAGEGKEVTSGKGQQNRNL